MTDPPPLTPRLAGVSDFLEQVDLVTARLLAGGANHLTDITIRANKKMGTS